MYKLRQKLLILLTVALVVSSPSAVGAYTPGPVSSEAAGNASSSQLRREIAGAFVVVTGVTGMQQQIPCTFVDDIISCSDGEEGLIGIVNMGEAPIGIQSASGTNKDVRIEVTGSGLNVTKWKTRARQYPFDGCIDHDAFFWARPPGGWQNLAGSVLYNGPCVQVPQGAWSIDWWTVGDGPAGTLGQYLDGTQLCNSWSPNQKLSGMPCITVHH